MRFGPTNFKLLNDQRVVVRSARFLSFSSTQLKDVLHNSPRRPRTHSRSKRPKKEVITILSSSDDDHSDEVKITAVRVNKNFVRAAKVAEVTVISSTEDEDATNDSDDDEVKIVCEVTKKKPAAQSVKYLESSSEQSGKNGTLKTENDAVPTEEVRGEHVERKPLPDCLMAPSVSTVKSAPKGALADEMLASFHYSIIHDEVAFKDFSEIPFKNTVKFLKLPAAPQRWSQDFVRLENNLALEMKDVLSCVDAKNKVQNELFDETKNSE